MRLVLAVLAFAGALYPLAPVSGSSSPEFQHVAQMSRDVADALRRQRAKPQPRRGNAHTCERIR
jgi:hypothetical protein